MVVSLSSTEALKAGICHSMVSMDVACSVCLFFLFRTKKLRCILQQHQGMIPVCCLDHASRPDMLGRIGQVYRVAEYR